MTEFYFFKRFGCSFLKICMQLFKCNNYDYELMKQGESSNGVVLILLLLVFPTLLFLSQNNRDHICKALCKVPTL